MKQSSDKDKKPATKSGSKKSTASKDVAKSQPKSAKGSKAADKKGARGSEGSSTLRYVVAILSLAISFVLFGSIVSYFNFWSEDQSITEWSYVGDSSISAVNSMGKVGAIIGNSLVGGYFGIFAMTIPLMIFFVSLLFFKVKAVFFRKAMVSLLLLTVVGSITAAFFTPAECGIFGSSYGGAWGYYITQKLQNILGVDGSAIIVLLLVLLWVSYTSFAIVKYCGAALKYCFGLVALFFGSLYNIVTIYARALRAKESKKSKMAKSSPTYLIDEEGSEVVDDDLCDEESEDDSFYEFDEEVEPDNSPFYESQDDSEEITLTDDECDDDFGRVRSEREALEDLVIIDSILDDEITITDHEDDEPQLKIEDAAIVLEDEKVEESVEEIVDEKLDSPKEDSFEIERVEPETKEESQFDDDKFEISVTSNALIDADIIPDDVVVTTNETVEAEDVTTSVYDPTLELSTYKLPPVELLENYTSKVVVTEQELYENKNRIVETLNNFNITIDKIKATIGPTVTLYEIKPAAGVRISKIKNLEDDIALSLSALGIRIIAPIPGKGTIGIEVPNKNKEVVSMYSVIKSTKFQESDYDLPIVLGRTIQNDDFVIDLAKMPHLLVAGATGQGKSVGLNAIITSLLYKKHPAELKFVLVDPKKVELTLYSSLEKHFLAKMASEEEAIITDTDKVIYTLNSLCVEMDSRYLLLKNAKVRNIKEYNEKFKNRKLSPLNGHRFLPYFVVIIDEFADLIMTAGREVETPIARIAQLARAVGIHLVIATQRPTTNIITGVIKANFPARVAFKVSSMIDSRTILDAPGANQLIGRGDMLVSNGNEVTRVQCAFVDTPEVERITDYIGEQRGYGEAYELPDYVPESDKNSADSVGGAMGKLDDKFTEIARYVVQNQQGSASTIQRNFSIGFNRAGRVMDQLERAGIVGRQEGSKPRQVLISDMATLELKLYDMENN